MSERKNSYNYCTVHKTINVAHPNAKSDCPYCLHEALTTAEAENARLNTIIHNRAEDREVADLLVAAKKTLKVLKEFACTVIREECWGIEMDGLEIQDLAVNLGLLAEHIATEKDVDGESDVEVGDKIYKFTEALKD